MFKKRFLSPSSSSNKDEKYAEKAAEFAEQKATAQNAGAHKAEPLNIMGKTSKLAKGITKGPKGATRRKPKNLGPMIGDPEYEKLFSQSYKDDPSTHTINPVKWLTNRKEKKQQEACRMEWQDFEIDRLKCENEILQIRDIKNERDKETLQQEIFDYKNCLAIAYVRLKKMYKDLRMTYESLKQVHEWIPEGEDEEEFMDIPELDEYGEDKTQLAGLVSDVALFIGKLKSYTEELFQRSATKYFASRGVASRLSMSRKESLDRGQRRASTPDHSNRDRAASFWLSDFHNADNKIHTPHDNQISKPWWKRSIGNKPGIPSPEDSDPDLSLKHKDQPVIPVRKSSSLNPYEVHDLPSAMAMLAFSHDDISLHSDRQKSNDSHSQPGSHVTQGGHHHHGHGHRHSQEHYSQHRRLSHEQPRSHSIGSTAQQLIHDMFASRNSVPQIVVSDDLETLVTSTADTPTTHPLRRKLTHQSTQSESDKSLKEKQPENPDPVLRQSSKELTKGNLRQNGSNKEIKQRDADLKTSNTNDLNAIKTNDSKDQNSLEKDASRKGSKDLPPELEHMAVRRELDIIESAESQLSKPTSPGNTSPGRERSETGSVNADSSCSIGAVMCGSMPDYQAFTIEPKVRHTISLEKDAYSVNSVSSDLFRLLQQTEHDVHMLRKEKEELLKQLDVAQNMLELLSQEVEEHKKEVAELKERCRKAKAILG